MKKVLFACILGFAPILGFSQGSITIFSEDGDKFFLVLNGVQQNSVAQTNVRVDGLSSDFYSAKILFEDNSKSAITKNMPTKDPASAQYSDVTYKIKKTKDGELKLRPFSMTPVAPNYTPPADMYVVHYGAANNNVTQTTQTTTVTNVAPSNSTMSVNAGGVNMNVNITDPTQGGGMSMNINMNNPAANTTVTQTSSTTTTTTMGADQQAYNNSQPANSTGGCGYPMDFNSFASAKQTIKSASFEDTKFSTAKTILASNCVSTDQVIEICKLFGFEQTKLDFAKFAYSKTTDPGNYFKVANVFGYDASKTELNNFISK